MPGSKAPHRIVSTRDRWGQSKPIASPPSPFRMPCPCHVRPSSLRLRQQVGCLDSPDTGAVMAACPCRGRSWQIKLSFPQVAKQSIAVPKFDPPSNPASSNTKAANSCPTAVEQLFQGSRSGPNSANFGRCRSNCWSRLTKVDNRPALLIRFGRCLPTRPMSAKARSNGTSIGRSWPVL